MLLRKVVALALAVVLCLCMGLPGTATQNVAVEDIAVQLLNDALSKPNYFDLPELEGRSIYICDAINPYAIMEGELIRCSDIEYYLVRTDSEYIACITLCYGEGELLSACLNIDLANAIEANGDINEAIQIVAQNGGLYVRTENAEETENQAQQMHGRRVDADDELLWDLEIPTVKVQLDGIVTNPIIPRSSRILNVPYVPQVEGTCWAAAGAAFGQYYTGNTYAHYTADYLAEQMGIGLNEGAFLDTTLEMVERFYGVRTEYHQRALSNSEAINLFQQAKPILAYFNGRDITSATYAGAAHMVVLCGYDDHNTGENITYYVRDSNTPSLMTVVAYSNEGLFMDYYYPYVMIWQESAYYVYSP